ncbi:MAG: hypothetical protein JSU70_18145 [Phycisphaerales bacterium]|nr:MAG: hypothetical protein JSU70_18145 [Phycisphaerales bacterium]
MRSDLRLLVLRVVLSFATHFGMAVQCRAEMKANEQFNTYLRPGSVLLSVSFPRAWLQGTVLGAGVVQSAVTRLIAMGGYNESTRVFETQLDVWDGSRRGFAGTKSGRAGQ